MRHSPAVFHLQVIPTMKPSGVSKEGGRWDGSLGRIWHPNSKAFDECKWWATVIDFIQTLPTVLMRQYTNYTRESHPDGLKSAFARALWKVWLQDFAVTSSFSQPQHHLTGSEPISCVVQQTASLVQHQMFHEDPREGRCAVIPVPLLVSACSIKSAKDGFMAPSMNLYSHPVVLFLLEMTYLMLNIFASNTELPSESL